MSPGLPRRGRRRFPAVAAVIAAGRPFPPIVDPAPDWAGWRTAIELRDRYGLGDVNLVKPGVGETTRVLLRRVPWRVLVRPDAVDELGHVLLLAAERGVAGRRGRGPAVLLRRPDPPERATARKGPGNTVTALVATDLDGTVMFSIERPPSGVLTVDTIADAYMTSHTAEIWGKLTEAGVIIPITTRSTSQYLRLLLPGRPPQYSLVCNGALLLVNGQPDQDWNEEVRHELAGTAQEFRTVWKQAARWHATHTFHLIRAVEEYFIYLTAARREHWLIEFAREAAAWARPRGWQASLQGRKLYLVPETLDKSVAVARLARRLGAERVFAGGDSLLDAGMLRSASAAIRPNHGELHRAGFSAPRCEVTADDGLAAGEEIVTWYAARSGLG